MLEERLVKLDWSMLLAFDQVDRQRAAPPAGGKIGDKLGAKVGSKDGVKFGAKIGA